jgi:hypothetical protein
MPEPLTSRSAYEQLIYSLVDRRADVVTSTLRLIPRSASVAEVRGEVRHRSGLALRVREVVDFEAATILAYSYEIRRGDEVLSWFDPQPHPDDAALAPTFPHHQHLAPSLKHHRVPAPGLSFVRPNIDVLLDRLSEWPAT